VAILVASEQATRRREAPQSLPAPALATEGAISEPPPASGERWASASAESNLAA
jgi:hypothetical protein